MLDEHIQKLQNMEPFQIYSIGSNGDVKPWYEVTGAIIQDLVLRDQDIAMQVQMIAAQIAHWARMVTQCRRVWEIEQHNYRIWRSERFLYYWESPAGDDEKPGWTKTAKGDPKAPTKEKIEALYRTDPDYVMWQIAIERAGEATSSAQGILDAFKAKRDVIRTVVWKNRDTGETEMSV